MSSIKSMISHSIFKIHVARMTILSKDTHKTLNFLKQYMNFGQRIPECKTSNPIFVGILNIREYFKFGNVIKAWFTHVRARAIRGLNAAIEIHDPPYYGLQQIEWLLRRCKSVKRFSFSCLEFCWDFYPDDSSDVIKIQNFLKSHIHLKNARRAWTIGKKPRVTYYIGNKNGDVKIKIYIRPKIPPRSNKRKKRERVRLEVTVKQRAINRMCIVKPSFLTFCDIRIILDQVRWIGLNEHELRRSLRNTLSGGDFLKSVKRRQTHKGIANTIIFYRRRKACGTNCVSRMVPGVCPKSDRTKCHATLEEIHNCSASRVMSDFENNYCQDFEGHEEILSLMEQLFNGWRENRHEKYSGTKPLFQKDYSMTKLKYKRVKGSTKRQQKERDFEMPKLWENFKNKHKDCKENKHEKFKK